MKRTVPPDKKEPTMRTENKRFPHPRLVPALCCCLLLLAGCEQEATKHEEARSAPLPPITVQVMTASVGVTEFQNEVVGTLEAVQKATISAKVTGTIALLPVVVGDTVKSGALLAKLNVAEISARLSQAETALAQAKRNLDREQRLLAKNASTRETVNTQEDAYQLARAALSEARAMLGYATIRAPFAGRVSAKLANAGDLATAGAPLLVLEDTTTLQVVAAVPEAEIHAIHPGDTLRVRVPAVGLGTTATVAEIAPTADAVSRTATIKLNLATDPALRPGQFVRVLLPGQGSKTLLVPESALSLFGQMERLFVVDTNTARLRLVRSGQHRAGKVEILTGLNQGEQVVVRAEGVLVDGQPVKVAP